MFAIVDRDGNLCPFATKYYKTRGGAKNGYNHARLSYIMQSLIKRTVTDEYGKGFYKWAMKPHLHPQECIGKTYDLGLFPGPVMTQAEADAISVKFDEFTNQYEIREVEMKPTFK